MVNNCSVGLGMTIEHLPSDPEALHRMILVVLGRLRGESALGAPEDQLMLVRLCVKAYWVEHKTTPKDHVPLLATATSNLPPWIDEVIGALDSFGVWRERLKNTIFDHLWDIREKQDYAFAEDYMTLVYDRLGRIMRILPYVSQGPQKEDLPEVFKEWRVAKDDALVVFGKPVAKKDLESLFRVSSQTIGHRCVFGGIPAEVAAVMPKEMYSGMPFHRRLLLGWEYWCNKEGIPLTDEDLFAYVPFHFGRVDSYVSWVDATTEEERKKESRRSGEVSLALGLYQSRKDPAATMGTWLDAVARHYGIGVRRLRTGHGGFPKRYPSAFDAHHRTTHCIPEAADHFMVPQLLKLLVGSNDIYDIPRAAEAFSNYQLLGFTAYIRRAVRQKYTIEVPEETPSMPVECRL